MCESSYYDDDEERAYRSWRPSKLEDWRPSIFYKIKQSDIYKRAVSAGFTFSVPENAHWSEIWNIRCDFTCVCGNKETLWCDSVLLDENNELDVAQILNDNGSFSENHLRKDSYSEEAIAHIRSFFTRSNYESIPNRSDGHNRRVEQSIEDAVVQLEHERIRLQDRQQAA